MKDWFGAASILVIAAAFCGLIGMLFGGPWSGDFIAALSAFALLIGTVGGGALIGRKLVDPINETAGLVIGALVGFFLLLMFINPVLSRYF